VLGDFGPLLEAACIGSISEIFDAEAPYTPRGCIAQAWSVAEVLRLCGRIGRERQDGREGQEGRERQRRKAGKIAEQEIQPI